MAERKKAQKKQKTKEQLLADQRKIARQLAAIEATESTDESPTAVHEEPLRDGPAKPPKPEVKGEDLDGRRSKEDFYVATDTEMVVFQPQHPLMAKPGRREQDGKLQRFFYYRRVTDDQVMCYTEAEAAFITQPGSSHRTILRQIGVSDGAAYMQSLRTCGVKPGDMIPIKKAREILANARAADIEAARGHFAEPMPQNVHFDSSFPIDQRKGFVPPR